MATKRKCFMCGATYEWCNTCHDFDPTETWKYLYHDKDCLAISKIWYAYRGDEISKDEAKKQMDKYHNNIAMILQNDSVPAEEIKEIYGVNKKEEAPMEIDIEEDATQDMEVQDQESKEIHVPNEPTKKQNNYYKNRKNNKK